MANSPPLTCKFYVSIQQPECGRPAQPVTATYPSGKTEIIDLCSQHAQVINKSRHNADWASRRLENKRNRADRLARHEAGTSDQLV